MNRIDPNNQEFRNSFHEIRVINRETEKAVAVTATVEDLNSRRPRREVLVWLPKSQLRDGMVPGWLIENKASEILRNANGQNAVFLCGYEF